MAKDVITRFKLETTAFDSAIKQASKELSDYSKTATKAKEGFNQFTKSNVDAARALGTMATSSNNLKGKLQELAGAYNEGVKAYKALSDEHKKSDWAKALAGSLTQLQGRIKETKAELQGLGDTAKNIGGGLFGGGKFDGMLQVFGGNMMTKAAGMAASFASEIAGCVTQGIELAKQGEGIRIAFERLGRGDIMKSLREATHGTVSDIELMKAAVKFNDFKLPIEELGTMLAFAQQKAKDTGQSVDYMVDSIVTGLGRKSLMILDNLGLSAAQIKERMAETGDMTKAVGDIIREEMDKAGDYVETAADRAAQASVDLQNEMEELGRKFAPVEEASNQLWTSMKIGILDIVGGPLARLLNGLTEAGRLKNMLNQVNGGGDNGHPSQVDKQLSKLRVAQKAGSRYMTNSLYTEQLEQYNRQINSSDNYIRQFEQNRSKVNTILQQATKEFGQKFSSISDLTAYRDAFKSMRDEYKAGAKEIMNPVKANIDNSDAIKNVESLKVKLAELQAQRKKAIAAGDTGKSNDLLKQINQVKKDIKGLDPKALTTSTTTHVKTEEQKNNEQIQKLTQEYLKTTDERKKAIRGEIKTLQDRNKEIKKLADEAQGVKFDEGSLPALNKQLRELQEAQSKAANGEEYRKLGAEIDTLTRKIAILKGELPKGETATITVSVDADKVDDLRNSLEQIDDKKMKVTVDYTDNSGFEDVSDQERTVTFTADDRDVVAKVLEMQHINIDPKTLEFRANDAEAMKAVEGMKNVTFDKKTLTVIPQTQEAAKELLKLNTFKLVDKQVAVTVSDDKAMKDLQAVAKVTIPDKEVKVKVTNPKAVDVKVNEVAGTQHQTPTLKPIEQTVNYKQGDVDLQDIPDEKTVRVDYEQGDMPDMPDDEQRTVTFKADDSDVLSKVADIKGITIDPKTLEFKADNAEAMKAVDGMKNVTFDKKTLTVVPQTQEAAKELLKLNTFKLVDKQVAVTVSDDKAMKDLQAVAKVTIPDKEVKVKVTNPKAVDVKVNEVAGTQHQTPTLKPIEQTVNYKQGDVDLQDIPDEKTVRVDYEQGDMPDMPDDEQRTVTFKADDTDVKKKVDDIEKKDITAKKVKLEISTENAETFKNITKQLDAQGVDRNVQFTVTPKIDKSAFNEQNLNAKIADLKNKMSGITIGTQGWLDMQGLLADAHAFSNMLQVAIKNGMDVTALNPEDFWKKIFGGTDIATTELQSMLDQINAYLKKHGLEPIKVNIQTGEVAENGKGKGKSNNDDQKSLRETLSHLGSAMSGITGGLKQLGIDIPEGLNKVIGGIQAVAAILTGISALVTIITALQGTKSIPLIGWLLHNGGVVHAANGYTVPGNFTSGDKVPAMLNSGEMVLNRAQQGNLLSQLEDNRGGWPDRGNSSPFVMGENIYLGTNNYLNRTGQGELVTTGMLKRMGLM